MAGEATPAVASEETPDVPRNFLFTPSLAERLGDFAHAKSKATGTRVTQASIVRQAVEEYLDRETAAA
jgi:hypothetical protein